MPTPTLDRLWLNDALTPSSFLALPLLRGSSWSWPVRGQVNRYAGGAARLVTLPGVAEQWQPLLTPVPWATVTALVERASRLHVARDPLGQRIGCVWLDPQAQSVGYGPSGELSVLTLTLQRMPLVEGV